MSAWRLSVAVGLLYVVWFGFVAHVEAATIISSNITSDTVWTASSSPYIIKTSINVSAGATLFIEPGVIIKFDTTGLFNVSGNIEAIGAEDQPIYLTSYHDDAVGDDTNNNGSATVPQARDWRAIQFNTGSTGRFDHTTVRYAGYVNSGLKALPAIYNNGGSVIFENGVVSDSNAYGIGQVAGSVEINDSEINRNTYGVVIVEGDAVVNGNQFNQNSFTGIHAIGSGDLELTDNIFSDNGIAADISLAYERDFFHSGNTAEGGVLNGLVLRGPITGNVQLSAGDMPYIVSEVGGLHALGVILISREGNLEVAQSGSFSLDPGVVIKFTNGSILTIDGLFEALGTKEEPIYFTSIKDDEVGGDTNDDGLTTSPSHSNWRRIQFNSGSQGNLDHAVVRYGGQRIGSFDLNQSGIGNSGGNIQINNSEIFQNNENGIRNEAGTVAIHNSSISGHSVYGIWNRTTIPLDALNNYWGDPSGPYHGSLNPTGLGNKVSNNVLFNPWLSMYPPVEEPPEPPPIDPLILQYEPVLYFHPDEDYYPMNVEAFVEGSGLWDGSFIDEVIIPRGDNNGLTLDYLASLENTENMYIAFSSDQAGEFDTAAAKTRYDNLVTNGQAVPTYYAYKSEDSYTDDFGNEHEFIVLQYWYFYAMNNWAEEGGFNNHEGDWESVFIFLDKNSEEPKYVAFSSHHNDGDPNFNPLQYESVRSKWEDVILDNGRAVSYVSLGSHANYSNGISRIINTFSGPKEDKVSASGNQFGKDDWSNVITILTNTPSWLTEYKGLFGVDKLSIGSAGIEGPLHNDVGGIVRFKYPIKWAGIDKITDFEIGEPEQIFNFDSQRIILKFSEALEVGTKLSTSLYDEFISFGENLNNINFLPHFWDFETSLDNGTFNAEVVFKYQDEELSGLKIIENDLTVYYFNEATNVWEPQPSFLNTSDNTVSFVTDHFSRYAIGTPKWETLTGGFEVKKRWGKYDPNTGVREAGVGLKGNVTGKVRILIKDITDEGVELINYTGVTSEGVPFIDVTLDANKPFDAKLLFSIPAKEIELSDGNDKNVPASLNFDYEVALQKII